MSNSIDKTLASLPYIKSIFGDNEIQKMNKKYEIFSDANLTKDKQVQRLSIVNQLDHWMDFATSGGRIPNMYYHQMMYSASSDDKKRRIIDYRVMSQFPEVEGALREICNEMFERDDQGETIKIALRNDYNEEIKELIQKEFQTFLKVFKFNERGWKYVWDFVTEGELFFENVVSSKKPELGVIGVTRIAGERIDPLYYDLDNELIDSYILRTKQPDQYPYQWGKFTHQSSFGGNNQHQLMFLNDKQVTYFANDMWESEGKKYRVPILANAHRPYRQLSLIEDATIIYMLVRAPERLVFNIDTGNLPASKAEQYVKRLMASFWSQKTIGNDGRVENTYDPMSLVENFYFPKSRDGAGTTVDKLGGGDASPDNMEILNFFVQKLYKALHVPLSRLNSDTAFSDGENISREELRFAEFIISVQKLWAETIKRSFVVHLKLRGKKIISNAKKLGINEVDVKTPDNKDKIKMPVKDIFKDDFDFKCWETYDSLSEEIDKAIALLEEKAVDQQNLLLEKIDALLLESRSPTAIQQEQEIFENSINVIYEKINEIKEDHLSWWEQYELTEEDIDIKFNEPTQFFALREQQIFQLKFDNYNNMSQNDLISNTFAQKVYLGLKDDQIEANRELLRKDAAFRWELAQIEANGPDFREKALAEMKGAAAGNDPMGGMGGGGGMDGGLPAASGGGGTSLPEFGESPESGGELGGGNVEGSNLPESPESNAGGEEATPPKAPAK